MFGLRDERTAAARSISASCSLMLVLALVAVVGMVLASEVALDGTG